MKKISMMMVALILSQFAYAQPDISENSKVPVYSESAPNPIGTYSQAIKVNDTVYLSGQIPIDPATGQIVEGDFKTQVRQVFKNLAAVAEASGGNIDDIVKLHVYMTNLNDFAQLNEVMAEYFTKPYPARAVMGVNALLKNASVEMDAIMQK